MAHTSVGRQHRSPYRLLVLDDAIIADETLVSRLAGHVRGGGSLIVEGEAAQFGMPAGDVLSGVLGVRDLGKTGHAAHCLSVLAAELASDAGMDDLVVEGEARRVAGRGAPPEPGRSPVPADRPRDTTGRRLPQVAAELRRACRSACANTPRWRRGIWAARTRWPCWA